MIVVHWYKFVYQQQGLHLSVFLKSENLVFCESKIYSIFIDLSQCIMYPTSVVNLNDPNGDSVLSNLSLLFTAVVILLELVTLAVIYCVICFFFPPSLTTGTSIKVVTWLKRPLPGVCVFTEIKREGERQGERRSKWKVNKAGDEGRVNDKCCLQVITVCVCKWSRMCVCVCVAASARASVHPAQTGLY